MSSRALETYARCVVRHRFVVLLAVLLTTLFLARAVTRLHVEVDPDRQLPQDHPFIQTLNDVHRIFGDKNLVVIGLFPHDGDVFTPAFLAKLAEVTDAVRRVPGANPALVQSLAAPQVKDIRGTEDGMEVERVMETPPRYAAAPSRTTPTSARWSRRTVRRRRSRRASSSPPRRPATATFRRRCWARSRRATTAPSTIGSPARSCSLPSSPPTPAGSSSTSRSPSW
jgi:hypothetical protein